MTIRVLIADDQELVRTGFRVIVNAEPDLEVVGEACDGKEVIDAARNLRPEVVLMDIRMPNLDGIQATRRITAGAGSPRVPGLARGTEQVRRPAQWLVSRWW
jgi:DNA-binding NarL/FixJ family response regulator